jgi:hypothetical protein
MNQTEVLNTQNERIEMRGVSMRIKGNSTVFTLQDVEFGIRSFFKKKMNPFFVTYVGWYHDLNHELPEDGVGAFLSLDRRFKHEQGK